MAEIPPDANLSNLRDNSGSGSRSEPSEEPSPGLLSLSGPADGTSDRAHWELPAGSPEDGDNPRPLVMTTPEDGDRGRPSVTFSTPSRALPGQSESLRSLGSLGH